MSAKYILSARPPFSPDWRKSYHPTFAFALGAAWRKFNRGWSVDSITNGSNVLINSEGLMQAFAQMDDLKRETPKRPMDEMSEQVIREMEKDGSEQKRARAPEGSDAKKSHCLAEASAGARRVP